MLSREKVSTAVVPLDQFTEKYKQYLTAFAFKKIKIEIDKMNDFVFDNVFVDTGIININNVSNVTKS